MPLDKSGTKEAFSRNVSTEMHAGKKQSQALAIAYAVGRRKRADGGVVDQYTTQLSPEEQSGYQSWKQKNPPNDSGYDYDLQGAYKAGLTPDVESGHFDDKFKKPNHPTFSTFSQYAKDRPDLAGTWDGDQYVPPVTAHYANGGMATAYKIKRKKRAAGGQLGPGAFNIQPKQMVRNEARQMTHAGPILSTVPGRTDHLPMKVKSGSYVVPAQAVSHLGQSNTLAGHAVINSMFSHNGPYGAGAVMKMGHGAGAPKPGKFKLATGGASDHGGPRGGSDGAPTDIIAAGGEHVLTPDQVRAVSFAHGGKGDLEFGHKVLDKWIMEIQKKHAATIKKLPRPARD